MFYPSAFTKMKYYNTPFFFCFTTEFAPLFIVIGVVMAQSNRLKEIETHCCEISPPYDYQRGSTISNTLICLSQFNYIPNDMTVSRENDHANT